MIGTFINFVTRLVNRNTTLPTKADVSTVNGLSGRIDTKADKSEVNALKSDTLEVGSIIFTANSKDLIDPSKFVALGGTPVGLPYNNENKLLWNKLGFRYGISILDGYLHKLLDIDTLIDGTVRAALVDTKQGCVYVVYNSIGDDYTGSTYIAKIGTNGKLLKKITISLTTYQQFSHKSCAYDGRIVLYNKGARYSVHKILISPDDGNSWYQSEAGQFGELYNIGMDAVHAYVYVSTQTSGKRLHCFRWDNKTWYVSSSSEKWCNKGIDNYGMAVCDTSKPTLTTFWHDPDTHKLRVLVNSGFGVVEEIPIPDFVFASFNTSTTVSILDSSTYIPIPIRLHSDNSTNMVCPWIIASRSLGTPIPYGSNITEFNAAVKLNCLGGSPNVYYSLDYYRYDMMIINDAISIPQPFYKDGSYRSFYEMAPSVVKSGENVAGVFANAERTYMVFLTTKGNLYHSGNMMMLTPSLGNAINQKEYAYSPIVTSGFNGRALMYKGG